MGRKQWDPWKHGQGPSEQSTYGGYENLALFGRVKKEDRLFRKQKPGPIKHIDVLTGEEVNIMPKVAKNAPVEEEIEEEDVEEEEDEDEDEETPAKGKRGNPGNLTPREPVAVPKKVLANVSPEVQKLLKQRDKLLAAGDQKGLRKVRALLRKAGFRLSEYAGSGDKIAAAAKAKKAKATEEDED